MSNRPLYGLSDLERLINPKTIAVIGASPTLGSFGQRTLENLAGFTGTVYGVNPKYDEVMGRATYPTLSALPEVPDCIIVGVGQRFAQDVIDEAGRLGIGGAIVYASGYRETGDPEGNEAQEHLVSSATSSGVRIAGPNCVGLVNTSSRAAMNFMTDCAQMLGTASGTVGIVSQSGALGYGLLQAAHRGMAFSKYLACGNSADVNVADYVSYLAEDDATRVIVCLLEGLNDGGAFLEAIRKAGLAGKPVIVYKAANSETSAKAAMSHTGTLAGSADAYRAALTQSGAVLVEDFEALVEVANFFTRNPTAPTADGVGIMATSGGAGVICADKAEANDLNLPALDTGTVAVLETAVPAFGSRANPADLTAEVLKDDSTFTKCLMAFCNDPSFGAVVVPLTFVHELTTGYRAHYMADVASRTETALAAVWMSEWLEGPGSRDLESDVSVAMFRSPHRCMWTIRRWLDWHAARAAGIFEQPSAPEVQHGRALALIDAHPEEQTLTETTAKMVLSEYGIESPAERFVTSPTHAFTISETMTFPLVLKVVSHDIMHKTDVGGLALNLTSPEEVERAVVNMQHTLAERAPEARIEGFSLQEMIEDGPEVLLGARFDPIFGPLLLLGTGGTWVEIIKDASIHLTPMSEASAREAVASMSLAKVFAGARGEAPYDVDSLVKAITAFSHLIRDAEGIASDIEINPIRVTRSRGAIALDALIIRTATPIETEGAQ